MVEQWEALALGFGDPSVCKTSVLQTFIEFPPPPTHENVVVIRAGSVQLPTLPQLHAHEREQQQQQIKEIAITKFQELTEKEKLNHLKLLIQTNPQKKEVYNDFLFRQNNRLLHEEKLYQRMFSDMRMFLHDVRLGVTINRRKLKAASEKEVAKERGEAEAKEEEPENDEETQSVKACIEILDAYLKNNNVKNEKEEKKEKETKPKEEEELNKRE